MPNSSMVLTTSKRILIFTTSYFPFVGGAEVAVKEITDRLSGEFEFDLITAKLRKDLPSVEEVGAVRVYRIGIGVPILDKLFLPYVAAIKTWKLHKKRNYIAFWGIMVTFSSGAAYIVNILRGMIGRKKVPMILTLQEGDSERYLKFKWGGLIDISWRMALWRSDYLTTISTHLLCRAERLGYKGHGFVIPNGVDVKKFENIQHRVLNRSVVTLITTSRLVEKNGIKDLINALKLLPNVKLRILGVGPLESELKLLATGLPVEFVGFVSRDEIPTYLHYADIFVRPSLSEGMGISFIEAMAAGLPVVATRVGGIPDFLKDGETGLFCEVKNPESIAKQVKRLIEDDDLREMIKKNALNMVRKKYDWDLIVKRIKEEIFDPATAGQVR
ncbi:MAG: glycosyltransferase family 4 protein [bacterium]|nr:glycosyltransferase family 4 protein [bacterium]